MRTAALKVDARSALDRVHARDVSDGADRFVQLLRVADFDLERADRAALVLGGACIGVDDVDADVRERLLESLASRPFLSSLLIRRCTERLNSPRTSQVTSTRRSRSDSIAFLQPRTCTVTPRPRVMKPMIGSPGTGPQHFP